MLRLAYHGAASFKRYIYNNSATTEMDGAIVQLIYSQTVYRNADADARPR